MAHEALKIYSFFAVICLSCGINVDIPQTSYEYARGDSASIPCNFTPQDLSFASAVITWTAHMDTENEEQIGTYYYYRTTPADSTMDITQSYEGRATIDIDIVNRVITLNLKGLTSKDTMVYSCQVLILKDKTGKSSDATRLIVLIAPSTPICQIQGKAEYYQNINLTCRSEEGTPTPTYSWANYDVTNKPRLNPPKATDVNGVLSLYNISSVTSGYYICKSVNKIRSASCNLTLAVMPPSMNMASTAGIIGACVAAALIVGIIVCCCCCRRKKNNEEEYTMGHVEYKDKDPHEIEEQHDDQVKSKPGDSDRHERYEDRSEQDYDHRSDRYSDRRDDYDDRRGRSNERPGDRNDDRRSDRYDDQRSDRYDDRRSDRYDDRRSDRYDDQRSDRNDDRRNDRYDDRRDRYDDRYDDRRDRYDDRYDDRRDRYDDRDRPPSVPPNKPTRG